MGGKPKDQAGRVRVVVWVVLNDGAVPDRLLDVRDGYPSLPPPKLGVLGHLERLLFQQLAYGLDFHGLPPSATLPCSRTVGRMFFVFSLTSKFLGIR